MGAKAKQIAYIHLCLANWTAVMVWFGLVWFGLVWFGLVGYGNPIRVIRWGMVGLVWFKIGQAGGLA